MVADLKVRSIKGLLWSAGEGAGSALLSLGTFMVMARVLEPRDFGVVALAGVFVFFFNLICGHSFADAIVQRRTLEADHLDTAFWSTLALALALMAVCQVAAGVAASALGEPALAQVLPWLSLVLPLGGASSVQMALFRRDMRFRELALRTLAGRTAGAAVGIAMALGGFGMWSLVGQQLAGTLASTVAVSAAAAWWPRVRFSARRLTEMWTFGFHVSANQVVTGAGEQTLVLLVGTLFGSAALGYFTVAWRMANLVRSLISSAVYHVGLSAFAKLQDDRAAITGAFLQSTRISCLVGFPIGVGMALVAGPLVVVLFGARWNMSAGLLVALALELVPAFYGMFLSALYRAMDRPAWGLGMAVLYFVVGVTGVLAFAPFGMLAVVAFWVVRAVLLMPIHVALVRRLLAQAVRRIAAPALVPLAASAVMAAGVSALRFALALAGAGPGAELAALVSAGAALYAISVWMLSPELVGLAARTARVMLTPSRGPS